MPNTTNQGFTKPKYRGREVPLTDLFKEALRHVAEGWADGESVRFEFMNVKACAPLVREFGKVTTSSFEYYDTHAGQTTRFRWTLPLAGFRKWFLYWQRKGGDLALPLTMRLPKGVA